MHAHVHTQAEELGTFLHSLAGELSSQTGVEAVIAAMTAEQVRNAEQ